MAETPEAPKDKAGSKRAALVASIGTAVLAAYLVMQPQLGLPDIPEWVWGALAALGITLGGAEFNKRTKPLKEEKKEE